MASSVSDTTAMYSLLANSKSGDETVRRPAEEALSQWEKRSGFCSCLMEIIASKDLKSHVDVRLTASVYLKNSIFLHWKNSQNSSSGLSNEEKILLRQIFLSHLREENKQIAETLAVLISKVASFDYPTEWPELFSVLTQQLHSADILASHRIFMILSRTLKELSIDEPLTADQRNFTELFEISLKLLQTDVQTLLLSFKTMAQTDGSNCAEQYQDELFLTCERWFLCLKTMRQLIISGFQSDAESKQEIQQVKEVSLVLLNTVQSFLPYLNSAFQYQNSKYWEFVKKACVKLMKVLSAVQSRHPYSSVLPVVVGFCIDKITDPEHDLLPFEGFLTQCMTMVKSVLECEEYKPSLTGPVMAETLSNERIVLLCNMLWSRYFFLTESDPEQWFQNPECFPHAKDMVEWTEKLLPRAQALYLVLFENYKQLLEPIVESILEEDSKKHRPPYATETIPSHLEEDDDDEELRDNLSVKMPKKIVLKSRYDSGKSFEVDAAVALQSQTITEMIKDKGFDENEVWVKHVPISTWILAKVIEYCKKHAEAVDVNGGSYDKDLLKAWDAEFMKVNTDELYYLVRAATYLNIKSLKNLTCHAVADKFGCHSPEWICWHFKIGKDFFNRRRTRKVLI